jgi:hypothetical protein
MSTSSSAWSFPDTTLITTDADLRDAVVGHGLRAVLFEFDLEALERSLEALR